MRIAAASIFVVVFGGLALLGQAAADGELSGRVIDATGWPVPGASVKVTGGGESRNALTDADGRFAIQSLGLTSYSVVIEIPGFITRQGTISLSPSSRRVHLEWWLESGCFETVLRIPHEVMEEATSAVIAHVRIESDEGPIVWSTLPECEGEVFHEYATRVLSAVAGTGDLATRPLMLRNPRADRLVPGADYLALFSRMSGPTHVYPRYLFAIVEGRVASPEAGELNGMSVQEALEVLRTWSQEGQ